MMISILIPVYNSERYLVDCLESIINQTSNSYEVVIIDDGSTDNSYTICNDYFKKNLFKMQIYSRENRGITFTRNELIKYAKGDYFIFLDSDDLLNANTVSHLEKIISNNIDVIAILYDTKRFTNFTTINTNETNPYIEKYSRNQAIIDFLTLKRRGFITGVLIRRSSWQNLNIIFKLEKYIEDWYPIFFYIANCNIIYYLHNDLYYYRQHDCSTISSSNLNIVSNYNIARQNILHYSNTYLNINKDYIDCFMVRTSLEIMHEFMLLSHQRFYGICKEYGCGNIKLKDILLNKQLSTKEKFTYISFKLYSYKYLTYFKWLFHNLLGEHNYGD